MDVGLFNLIDAVKGKKIQIFLQICRAPTTLKSEGEVTSLSGADKKENERQQGEVVRVQGEVVRVQGEVKIFLLLYHFSHSRGIIVAFVCYNVLVMH